MGCGPHLLSTDGNTTGTPRSRWLTHWVLATHLKLNLKALRRHMQSIKGNPLRALLSIQHSPPHSFKLGLCIPPELIINLLWGKKFSYLISLSFAVVFLAFHIHPSIASSLEARRRKVLYGKGILNLVNINKNPLFVIRRDKSTSHHHFNEWRW